MQLNAINLWKKKKPKCNSLKIKGCIPLHRKIINLDLILW